MNIVHLAIVRKDNYLAPHAVLCGAILSKVHTTYTIKGVTCKECLAAFESGKMQVGYEMFRHRK